MNMKYSSNGLHLTEMFEGFRSEAYPDPVKGWSLPTIGYGYTGPDVYKGDIWTVQQAIRALQYKINIAESNVNQYCTRSDLTQGEFDAMVDFAYNCGCRNLDCSTLLELVNEGDFEMAAKEFDKWDHACGQVVAGLLRRREAERKEFEGGGL